MERSALFCDTSARMSERPSHDWLRRLLATLALVACVLVVLWPVWSEGRYPITHEAAYGDRYAVLVGHFKAALDAGVWYPRWLPDLKGGYGYPTFVFYQPAFFFLAGRVAQVSALGLAKATYVAVALFLFFGAVGAYLAARERSGRLFSLFGAAFFLFTPWICTNLYVRGDLSELTSVMALPWVTLFVIQAAERIRAGVSASRALVGLSFALALVIYSHPTTALSTFAVVPLLGLGVVGDLPERRLRALGAFAVAYVAALALAAPYWLPVMQLKSLVRLEGATTDYYLTYRHLLEPQQLFARTFEFGSSALDSPNDTMPFQAGLVQVVLAVLGFVVARRQWSSRVRLIGYVGLLFMMTTSSAFIWKNVGALAIFQFPWRLLSPVTWLQWWLVLGLAERAWSRLNVAAGVVATAVTLAWGRESISHQPWLAAVIRGDGRAALPRVVRPAARLKAVREPRRVLTAHGERACGGPAPTAPTA